MTGNADRPLSGRAVVPEARAALSAILTGEQTYFQKLATYTDAADTSEIRARLGVYLAGPSGRWDFTVRDASARGFTARAKGRVDTEAEGFLVTLEYVRGHPPTLSVRREPQPTAPGGVVTPAGVPPHGAIKAIDR